LSLATASAACLVAAGACSAPGIEVPFPEGAADTPTPAAVQPTPPPPPKVLVVCLAEEPNTLYIYDSPNAAAQMILPALYDGPFDVRGYQHQPVILEAVPSVESGSVRLEPVTLVSGDLYFNPETALPETLSPGKAYLPSGCTSPDCLRRSEGGQITMDRQVVEFTLLPGLTWSDGQPLTAQDSVFSFNLDADPDTPTLKDQVNRTAAYEAVDDRTVRWTGIPGFFDSELAANFWSPLPEHLLGSLPAGELPTAPTARAAPIGWGPYVLERWTPGEALDFVPNPNYRRRGEGLPTFDRLRARVISGDGEAAVQQVLTGECDVLDERLLDAATPTTLQGLAGDERIQWRVVPGTVIERLDFGTAPVDDRPAILAESEVRRAIAACIDRDNLNAGVVAGLGAVPRGFLPAGHPLESVSEAAVAYDPTAATEGLAALGWIDDDGEPETPRLAQGVDGVAAGTPLRLSLVAASGSAEEALAEAVRDDLARCGVAIEVESVPAETLYAPWPEGPVFGRSFDLVLWPWLGWIDPACELFLTSEIPTDAHPEGVNASGFSDGAYDRACAQARIGPVAGPAYPEAVARTQEILAEQVPAMALLQWPRLLVASDRVCGLSPDPTAGALWNVEELQPGPGCASNAP
jgi:peptide/nickel transport system substrate-binding protein